jgi:hypothetical protein
MIPEESTQRMVAYEGFLTDAISEINDAIVQGALVVQFQVVGGAVVVLYDVTDYYGDWS